MSGCESGSVWCFAAFLSSLCVWDRRFLPHVQHGSMLSLEGCGCGGMLKALRAMSSFDSQKLTVSVSDFFQFGLFSQCKSCSNKNSECPQANYD